MGSRNRLEEKDSMLHGASNDAGFTARSRGSKLYTAVVPSSSAMCVGIPALGY